MAWFTRFTRFGDAHLVYGQEANMSCGIASVMMCIFKVNKLKPGHTAVTIEKQIYKEYEAAIGSAYKPEEVGTFPQHLATILNKFTKGDGSWKWHKLAPEEVSGRVISRVGVTSGLGPTIDVKPMILGVDWDLGGAHWVVVDTVREMLGSNYATICDPWDANVHLQKIKRGSPFVYHAGEGGFSMNFGGKTKGDASPYDNTSRGMVKTWGMIYRS
ncbi:MAG: hypothetical protein IT557_13715 [Alphaproteobacteria bacterium]|nr:hypothetical protein [Alphaproteobacteria bacterium]